METKQTYFGEQELNDFQKNTSVETFPIHTTQNEEKHQLNILDRKLKNKSAKKKSNINSTSYDFSTSTDKLQKNKLEEFLKKTSNNKLMFKLNNSIENQFIYKKIDKKNKISTSTDKSIRYNINKLE